MADLDVIEISPSGDVVLCVRRDEDSEIYDYKVDSSQLQAASAYFARLLGGSFREALEIQDTHDKLRTQYGRVSDAPTDELPRVTVVDIGRTSKLSTIKNIVADFLRLLHNQDLSQPLPPVANLANLAVVADRFDALETLSAYIRRKRLLHTIDMKTKVKDPNEDKGRQKIWIGYLADYDPWVARYSKSLILGGSRQWQDAEEDHRAAMWWDLPRSIEDELRYRREKVLQTLSSVFMHFVKLYSTGERQCKLGYDSSLACDSFQLGQMISFLNKTGLIQVQSLLIDSEPNDAYKGDIDRLLDTLRRCPNYQIDRNHGHCGLRTHLIPILDRLQFWVGKESGSQDLGICVDCYKNRKEEYAWLEAKPPLTWRVDSAPPRVPSLKAGATRSDRKSTYSDRQDNCLHRHTAMREMFIATDRIWS